MNLVKEPNKLPFEQCSVLGQMGQICSEACTCSELVKVLPHIFRNIIYICTGGKLSHGISLTTRSNDKYLDLELAATRKACVDYHFLPFQTLGLFDDSIKRLLEKIGKKMNSK